VDNTVQKVCRKLGGSQSTFCTRKNQDHGLSVAEPHRLRQPGEEKKELKLLVADLSLEKTILQESLQIASEARPAAFAARGLAEAVRCEGAVRIRRADAVAVVVVPPTKLTRTTGLSGAEPQTHLPH
jgi:putative transposase